MAIPALTEKAKAVWKTDLEQWQAELGNLSLSGGINTFPISMDGHDDDLMLRLNAENCPKFSKGLEDHEQYIDALTKDH